MLQVNNVSENLLTTASTQGFATSPTQHFFLERYQQAYKSELDDFIEAIQNNAPLAIGGNHLDGLKSMQLAEIAYQSLEKNQPIACNI